MYILDEKLTCPCIWKVLKNQFLTGLRNNSKIRNHILSVEDAAGEGIQASGFETHEYMSKPILVNSQAEKTQHFFPTRQIKFGVCKVDNLKKCLGFLFFVW